MTYIPRHRFPYQSQDDFRNGWNEDYSPRHRLGTPVYWTPEAIYRLFRRGIRDLASN